MTATLTCKLRAFLTVKTIDGDLTALHGALPHPDLLEVDAKGTLTEAFAELFAFFVDGGTAEYEILESPTERVE